MKNIVENINGELTTTSLIIAEEFGRTHKNVLKSLDKLVSRLQMEPRDYIDSRGKTQRMYVLDERSFLIAMPFIGGNKSEEGQERLVDAFLKLTKENQRLREQRLTIDWQEARANGKCIRNILTSAIACLERTADKQGGVKLDKNGNNIGRHYFETTTKMIYKALFGDSSLKNVRDKLDGLHLNFLSIIEDACAQEIERLVELDVDYHDIYAEAKKRVIDAVDGLSKSKLESKKESLIKLAWENKDGN